jgi:hypothetical protein
MPYNKLKFHLGEYRVGRYGPAWCIGVLFLLADISVSKASMTEVAEGTATIIKALGPLFSGDNDSTDSKIQNGAVSLLRDITQTNQSYPQIGSTGKDPLGNRFRPLANGWAVRPSENSPAPAVAPNTPPKAPNVWIKGRIK